MRKNMLRAIKKYDTLLTMGKHATLERYGFDTTHGTLDPVTFPLLSANRTVSYLWAASAAGPYPLYIKIGSEGSPTATQMTAKKVSDGTEKTFSITWSAGSVRYENSDIGLTDYNWWKAANGNDLEITFS